MLLSFYKLSDDSKLRSVLDKRQVYMQDISYADNHDLNHESLRKQFSSDGVKKESQHLWRSGGR